MFVVGSRRLTGVRDEAIGAIMNSAWVNKMAVEYGTTCKAQGVIKHISDVGPAIW